MANTPYPQSYYAASANPVPPRPALQGEVETDVCIIGAGYTGLWTAYYLKKADPGLDIVVVEREFAGFGASGRNGGWLSGGFAWSREKYLKTSSRGAVVDMQRAMAGTVDEVIHVCTAEGIDADILRVDNITVATNATFRDWPSAWVSASCLNGWAQFSSVARFHTRLNLPLGLLKENSTITTIGANR